jgi:hypothetical protein
LQYEVLGGRSGQTVVTLDGVADVDTTQNASTSGYVNPNVDAISEMKVMLTNYTAEYGIRSGGTINVSIKNGTKEFHGSAYYFKRHEKLNANEWNNNRNNQPKSRYRYDNFGGTIGGPILIPGTGFNKDRDKLFFFVSLEWLRNVSPSNAQRRRFPTELERKGDFSQTVDRSGAVYPVYKPGTKEQWPGNVIPESYGDALGKAFLDFYPMPNRTDWSDGDNSYNWIGNWLTENPRNEQIFRIDWNVAAATNFKPIIFRSRRSRTWRRSIMSRSRNLRRRHSRTALPQESTRFKEVSATLTSQAATTGAWAFSAT